MQVHLRRNNDDDDGMFDRATEIFNRMLFMAATIPRNYIIDERKNVYLNTRKDMLKPFADFQKVAIYLLFIYLFVGAWRILLYYLDLVI